ncbi:MAG: GIY-YIG nuclease family protein [Chloroflexi bacterium]|nr:GIY-YIG nuclease family protein [Chloroflexota bacterium]MBI5715372.1 GIY-YIG nuclease family protein [Chloroflexota bacterium]
MATEEIDTSYLYRKTLQQRVFDWLLDARYWLGFLAGRGGENDDIRCEYLEFGWYVNRGVGVYINARRDYVRYFEWNLNTFNAYGRRPFDFRLPNDVPAREHFIEVEELIQKFFPRIHRANTWAICEVAESENCLAKRGISDICIELKGHRVCWDCKELQEKRTTKGFTGFVYLIGNKEKGLYKIGVSRQPKERHKAINTKLPFKVEKFHEIAADNITMKKAESLLHKWFRGTNTHGEWFELSESEVTFICSLVTFENGRFIDVTGNEVLEYQNNIST